MNLSPDLQGARLSVVRAAELAGMHPAHFRRLCRRGVFPKPRKTATSRPYFDYDLLILIAGVLKSGIGQNGVEVCFYRQRRTKRSSRPRQSQNRPDRYMQCLAEGLTQIGIHKNQLAMAKLDTHLAQAFGKERPDLATAIATLAQRLLA